MKNANFMASLKAFFSKAWTATKAFSIKAGKWIVANKLISIPVAVVLVGGIACAIALPIALHEHDFATEWSTDANNHWHSAICSHEEEKSDLGAHAYDNACDTTCNVCGETRTVGAHAYDNACDTTCNTCGAIRTVGEHVYDNACDTTCNTCGATRMVGAHVYDNACDTTCNNCGATRAITHDHADTLTAGDTTHYYLCSVCGDRKDEVAHVFDKTVASGEYLKAAATATTKAQYYKSCVCGKASAIEYFETDKAPANLQVSDISKAYDGTSVAEPTVTFDGVGGENFAYYKGNEKLTERPTDAGTYKVVVTVDETETHAGDRVEREFTIAKKTLNYLELTKVYNDKNRGFGPNAPTECQLGVDHGVIAGDSVFLETCDDIEYNVGAYTLTRANSGETNDTVWLYGTDAGNYDFQGDANDYAYVVGEITVTKRPVWAENVEFTYDGYTKWTGEESPNQIVFQNMANGETMDSSFVTWTFDSINVDATLTSVEFMDEDDGRSNYEIDFSKCTASIIPRVIDNLTYAFEYNGMEYHQAVISKNEHSGIVGDDQISLEVCFATPNVGSALDTDGEFGFEPGFVEDNYVLGENYSFSIVPAKLTLKAGEKIETEETYNGQKQYAFSVSSDRFDGYVDTEAASLMLTATLPSKNVGVYTADDVILTPYVGNSAFGTESHNYDFSEVEATVTIKPLTVSLSSYVKVEYNGTSEFTLATPFDLTSANTGGGQESVSDNDEVYITWIETSDADITDETFAIDYTLGGADAGNYDIDELGVEITKKKLTKLNIKITAATADSLVVTLLPKDGVIPGEVVKIKLPGLDTNQDFYNYTEIEMLIDEAAVRQGQEYVTLLTEGNYANYELATYDNNGVQMVGIISCVDECDVQYDGSCNCGTSHLIGTAASSVTRTTLPCATTWTGGVYEISTLAGYWSILPSDNFADITAIYDANGNEVEIDANDAGFYAEAGTYYVHISKASDLGSAKHITFTHTHTLANLEGSAAKSDLITAKSGDAIFFRIENDAPWGASMNVFSDNETTLLDSSKYTVKVYDEYFKELTGVIYDGTDVYHATDDNYSVVDKTIYIEVLLSADTNVQIYIY